MTEGGNESYIKELNESLNLSNSYINETDNKVNERFEALFLSLPIANLFALVVAYLSQQNIIIKFDCTLKVTFIIGLVTFLFAYIFTMIYYAYCQIMYSTKSKNTSELLRKVNGNTKNINKYEKKIIKTIKTNNNFPCFLSWLLRLRNILSVISLCSLTIFFTYGVCKMPIENNKNTSPKKQ